MWTERVGERSPEGPLFRPGPSGAAPPTPSPIEAAPSTPSGAEGSDPGAGGAWDPTAALERLVTRIRARHLSPRTERTYLSWVRRYFAHFGMQDPRGHRTTEVDGYLEHLATERGLGATIQNQAASAIAFLHRELWGRDLGGVGGIRRAREPSVTPRNASVVEIDRVMRHLSGASRVAAAIMYGSGTRVAETVALRVKDVGLAHRELTVRGGKGAQDRTTLIPRSAVPLLRAQMDAVEERHVRDLEAGHGWAPLPGALHRKDRAAGWTLGWQFLFPSTVVTTDPKTKRRGRRPVHVTTIQRAVKQAVRRSGVTKTISCHVLRHCFATELLRAGVDVRTLQRLLGHRDLKTTARYLHIADRPGQNIDSPLDRLPSLKAELDAFHRGTHRDLGLDP